MKTTNIREHWEDTYFYNESAHSFNLNEPPSWVLGRGDEEEAKAGEMSSDYGDVTTFVYRPLFAGRSI